MLYFVVKTHHVQTIKNTISWCLVSRDESW